jgi:hypothetical protein
MNLLGLTFTAPAVLAALIALPAIWWLLRFTPPAPRVIVFPPTRILREVAPQQETPATSPWWLTLLRLLIAALVILALAGPVRDDAPVAMEGSGPVALVIDDGWTAAADWEQRLNAARRILDAANRADRPVILGTTANARALPGPMRGSEAVALLDSLAPQPFPPDRAAASARIAPVLGDAGVSALYWLSDGIDHGAGEAFARGLAALAPGAALHVVAPGEAELPIALGAPANGAASLTIPVLRAESALAQGGQVIARDAAGRQLGEAAYALAPGETTAEVQFELPSELRNAIERVELASMNTAGAVQLLDRRSQRRVVGILSSESEEIAQPLLSGEHYLARALGPRADLRVPSERNVATALPRLIEQGASVLILADIGTIPDAVAEPLREWVQAGGVLVRFAGPRLSAGAEDDLVPVQLRRGERALGGTLSWLSPRRLDAFPPASPFAGIAVDPDTVVSRQVLAEPSIALPERTWAQLEDGTPLVTAAPAGEGWLLLFHVTADTRWSNLPLSGSFVEMLDRVLDLAGGAPASGAAASSGTAEQGAAPAANEPLPLPPLRLLDGFGRFGPPGALARPLPADAVETTRVSATHPPGFYGPPDAPAALNVMKAGDRLERITTWPEGASLAPYPREEAIDLVPYLLLAALLLLLLDALASLWLTGRLPRLGAATAALLLTPMLLADGPAHAQGDESFALQAANGTSLAYARTGDPELDRISEAGLRGLSIALAMRTALEPSEPMGVDISRDELAFFPLIYWPVDPAAPPPDAQTLARMDAYMKQGGTILFDTRDAYAAGLGLDSGASGPGGQALQALLEGLDIPPLEPVPPDHVLTKTFYLLNGFPGRFESGSFWVEALPAADENGARPARAGDGVSPIMITGNDLAGAWAVDETGRPLLPVEAGNPAQREMAYRAGVNIVMYTLTGNYKADQVHIPALLERLGQ